MTLLEINQINDYLEKLSDLNDELETLTFEGIKIDESKKKRLKKSTFLFFIECWIKYIYFLCLFKKQ